MYLCCLVQDWLKTFLMSAEKEKKSFCWLMTEFFQRVFHTLGNKCTSSSKCIFFVCKAVTAMCVSCCNSASAFGLMPACRFHDLRGVTITGTILCQESNTHRGGTFASISMLSIVTYKKLAGRKCVVKE